MKNSVARDLTSSIKLTPLFLSVVATITVALALPLVFHWLTADSASPPGYGVALAIRSARNTDPFIAQTYNQAGTGRILTEIGTPIMVNGRHWGGLRINVEPQVLN